MIDFLMKIDNVAISSRELSHARFSKASSGAQDQLSSDTFLGLKCIRVRR